MSGLRPGYSIKNVSKGLSGPLQLKMTRIVRAQPSTTPTKTIPALRIRPDDVPCPAGNVIPVHSKDVEVERHPHDMPGSGCGRDTFAGLEQSDLLLKRSPCTPCHNGCRYPHCTKVIEEGDSLRSDLRVERRDLLGRGVAHINSAGWCRAGSESLTRYGSR